MKKIVFSLPVMIVAVIVLGYLYSIQPERLTPERVKKAMAAERALADIEQAEAELEGETQVAQADNSSESADKKAVADTEENDVPDSFKVKFECSNGEFVAEFHKDWSEAGAERVYELVKSGYFKGARFFRVIDGFMAQFGIAGEPSVTAKWKEENLPAEPVKKSNTRGMISFAMRGAGSGGNTNDTRTTQLFINYGDNSNLDGMGFAPVGEVVEGMDVVDDLHSGYGDGPPRGRGPNQSLIEDMGNTYLEENFPQLDYIKEASIVNE